MTEQNQPPFNSLQRRSPSQRSDGSFSSSIRNVADELCQKHHKPVRFIAGVSLGSSAEYRLTCPQCNNQSATSLCFLKPVDRIKSAIIRLERKAKNSSYGAFIQLHSQLNHLNQQLKTQAYNEHRTTADWYDAAMKMYEALQGGDKRCLVKYSRDEDDLNEAELQENRKSMDKYSKGLEFIVESMRTVLESKPLCNGIEQKHDVCPVQLPSSQTMQQMKEEIGRLQNRLEGQEAQHQKALQQLMSKQSAQQMTHVERGNQMQAAEEQNAQRLLSENRSLREQQEGLSRKVAELNMRIQQLTQSQRVIRFQKEEFQREKQADNDTIKKQKTENDTLSKLLEKTKSTVTQQDIQMANIKSKLKRSESELVQFQQAAQSVQTQLKEERQTSKALQQKIDQLTRNTPENGQKGLDDKYQIQALKNDMLEKDREITRLRDQIGHLDKRLQEASTRNVPPGSAKSLQHQQTQTILNDNKESPQLTRNRRPQDASNNRPQPHLQRPPSTDKSVPSNQAAKSYGPSYLIPGQTYTARTSDSPVRTVVTSSNQLFRDSRIVQNNTLPGKLLSYFGQVSIEVKQAYLLLEGCGKTIEEFHAACDNKRNLLLMMELKEGGVYGGFTENGWCKSNQLGSKKSFMLNSRYDKIAKWNGRGSYPTALDPRSGPQFIPGILGVDKLNRGFCKKVVHGDPYDYPDVYFFPRDPNVDTTKFDITAYEIWQIIM